MLKPQNFLPSNSVCTDIPEFQLEAAMLFVKVLTYKKSRGVV